jgi:methionyl-tRNA formyltransferase
MADCLLLLSDGMLAAPLSEVLRQHNPRLAIVCVQNGRELTNAMETVRYFDRMIAFCTETIVPAATLAAIRGPSYNFHPAPPDYPGSHPASFAIYDRVGRFGATAHEMAVRVDSGPIVAVEPFDVPPDTGRHRRAGARGQSGRGRRQAVLAPRAGAGAL